MSKQIGIRAAVRLARSNAAALIDAMDLEQLYGGDYFVNTQDEDVLQDAQHQVVEFIRTGKVQ